MKSCNLIISLSFALSVIACGSPSDEAKVGSQTVLSANREAPIGWVKFDAYSDSTFTYSLSSRDKYHGTYSRKGDTLLLTCADSTIGIDTVVVEDTSLKFVGEQTPGYAGITINTLTK